jgi:putative component of membrane protein insertase Oxa1/YidC/SpoIIIJ protein YidD
MNIIEKIYLASRSIRQVFLFSVFGVVSECKHSPTCGEYFVQVLKTEGVVTALRKGSFRIITCY